MSAVNYGDEDRVEYIVLSNIRFYYFICANDTMIFCEFTFVYFISCLDRTIFYIYMVLININLKNS